MPLLKQGEGFRASDLPAGRAGRTPLRSDGESVLAARARAAAGSRQAPRRAHFRRGPFFTVAAGAPATEAILKSLKKKRAVSPGLVPATGRSRGRTARRARRSPALPIGDGEMNRRQRRVAGEANRARTCERLPSSASERAWRCVLRLAAITGGEISNKFALAVMHS
ncbi:uncharacterized protein Tco025E_07309 [Trypanosoma conorhini]|uniref:Uncharacterized protein n=1 Tax=Trypanosoma conorhini TaxID=83891 RepID=A0A3R7L4X3_9TRYP|nr:uncharacterized protein Tco025E_07309 [Trypanosoma conorhini]RNF07716.1 hypothetical protein Tco025E_07309 [Trypanosoma conorhini]